MDSSAFRNLDLDGVFRWAIFGVICAGLMAVGMVAAAIYFIINHVQIV